jgi:hypothetical protein
MDLMKSSLYHCIFIPLNDGANCMHHVQLLCILPIEGNYVLCTILTVKSIKRFILQYRDNLFSKVETKYVFYIT